MYKLIVLLTSLFVLSSCNPEFYKLIPATTVTDSNPAKLRLTGSQSIIANSCTPYTVARLNLANALVSPTSSTVVTLNPRTNGSFHLLSDCSDGATTTVTIDAGSSSKIIYYTNTGSGIYDLLASGLTTPATLLVTILSDVPEFSFEQESFSITEAGVAVGNALNIRRSIPGASQSVTITGEGITNYPGEVNFAAQVINFAPGDTVKTVVFPLSANPSFSGDRFFKAKLSTPTNASVIGAQNEATINILENEIPTKFFFPQPLFTARENGGTVSIRIQRVDGDPSLPETVTFSTINGTAVTPTHFLSVPQTITFNPGDKEKTVTVSIVDNALQGDSKSFFIELKNPNAGTDLITRPWSTAKVRILDNDDTAVCDSANTGAFGGGLGTISSPYLICSVDQLNQISADPDKYYKIMTDLDMQGFSQISTHFSGSLDGNERVLKNFRTSGTGKRGMFISMGSSFPSITSISNLNLIQAYVESSDDYAAGIMIEAWGDFHTMSGNLFSGAISSPSLSGGILGRNIAQNDMANSNNLSHGTIYGDNAGGIIGYAHNTDMPTIWIDRSYSTSFVFGAGTIGGLFGNYDYAHGKLHISNSHAKGYITGTGSAANTDHYAGGLIGGIVSQSGSDISVTNSFYEGAIAKATRAGGLIGKSSTFDGAESYSVTYNANRVQAKIEARGNAGGLIGSASTDVNLNLSNNNIIAQITEDTSVLTNSDYIGIGGIVGYINTYGSPDINIRDINLSNKNSITAVSNGNKGGFVGGASFEGFSSAVFSNLDYYGTIIAPASQGVGGIVGSVRNSPGTNTTHLEIDDCHTFGNISGRTGVGGIVGGLELNSSIIATPTNFTLNNVSSAGDISAVSNEVGGIVGYNYQGDYTQLLIRSAFSSGSITGDNKIGGIMGSSTIDDGANSYTQLELSAARGDIHATTTGASFMGGLVGIYNCHDQGAIVIDRSYSSASLTSTGEDVGGLVDGMEIQNGACTAEIRNSYSSGTIDSTQWTTGLVAYYKFETSNGGDFKIINSYSSSRILNQGGAGMDGLVHAWMPSDTVTITNSFFAQQPGYNDGLPVQSYSMAIADFLTLGSTYNWAVGSIWEYKTGAQYPTLIQNPEP